MGNADAIDAKREKAARPSIVQLSAMIRDGSITPEEGAEKLCSLQENREMCLRRIVVALGETILGR